MFRPRYAVRPGTEPTGYCEGVTEQKRAGSARAPQAGGADQPGYPGRDLGLPETGQGAVASMSRRVGALFVDWLLCWVIVVAAIRPYQADVAYWTLLVFAAQDYLFTALTGFTMGKLLLRIRVVRLDGGTVGAGWGLVRTLLLLTVIPPLIFDRDLRGMHDRATNSVVVRV
jgi:RDD family